MEYTGTTGTDRDCDFSIGVCAPIDGSCVNSATATARSTISTAATATADDQNFK
jgi:hypothetical protein